MCIIMIKCSGVELPDEATFARCTKRNKDGSGFMWIQDGKVHGKKGYKSGASARAAIMASVPDYKNKMIVYHARYATHGAVGSRCCHPFPITPNVDEMGRRKWMADKGVAHNGVFYGLTASNAVSDTMAFIKDVLCIHPEVMNSSGEQTDTLFRMGIGSNRLAIMIGPENRCITFGSFEKDPNADIYYSNNDWAPPPPVRQQSYYYSGGGAYRYGSVRDDNEWVQSNVSCAGCIDTKTHGDQWPCKSCFSHPSRPYFSIKNRTSGDVSKAADLIVSMKMAKMKETRKNKKKNDDPTPKTWRRCELCAGYGEHVAWDEENAIYICDSCSKITIG